MRPRGSRPSGLSAERQRHVEDHHMADKLRGALVLTVGRYGDWNADEHAIRRLVDNFNATRDRSGLSVPLILGHDAQQSFAQNSGLPALGRCTRLYVDQKKGGLRADFADVPSLILDMIRNRSYRTFSVEVDPQWEETGAFKNGTATDIRGPVLRRVALLGADVPRCRDLEDLGRLVAHAPHAEAVHCEQLADLIRVSIPAVPANEIIHLAEGSNVL